MSRTFFPAIAKYPAAEQPPGPPPTTIASNADPESGTSPVSIGSSQAAMYEPLVGAL